MQSGNASLLSTQSMKNNISLTQTANFFDNAFKVIHPKYYKYWKVYAQNIWANIKWVGLLVGQEIFKTNPGLSLDCRMHFQPKIWKGKKLTRDLSFLCRPKPILFAKTLVNCVYVLRIYLFDNAFFSSPLPRPQLLHKLYNMSHWGQISYKLYKVLQIKKYTSCQDLSL